MGILVRRQHRAYSHYSVEESNDCSCCWTGWPGGKLVVEVQTWRGMLKCWVLDVWSNKVSFVRTWKDSSDGNGSKIAGSSRLRHLRYGSNDSCFFYWHGTKPAANDWLNSCRQRVQRQWKKCSERRKHCALAVVRWSQKISPRRRPTSQGRGTAKI